MKKKGILLLAAVFLFICGFAQRSVLIQKAYAFYAVSVPGMAMADEKGNIINPVPIAERYIYVEYFGKNPPDIVSVSYDNIPYKPGVIKISESRADIGKSQKNGKEIILSSRKGYGLWKVDLQTTDGKVASPTEAKNISLTYRTAGQRDRRSAIFRINKETQLMVPDRY